MVQDSGTPACPDSLRPLNLPRPASILACDGRPTTLVEGGSRHRVAHVQDEWRIDDEWWREPIARRYYRIVLATGALHTVYHDLIRDAWYEQTY